MATKNIDNLRAMIQEEQWTLSTLQNYSINDFKAMDLLWEEVRQEIEDAPEKESEIREFLEESLAQNKNNITGGFFSANLTMLKHSVNDSDFINLSEKFVMAKRWNIVEAIAQKALSYGESRSVLHLLAESYKHLQDEEKEIDAWQRLVRIDHSEADIVVKLAKHREKSGNIEEALSLYQKALIRYLNKEQLTPVYEIWEKLIDIGENAEYLLLQEQKIEKKFNEEKSLELLSILYASLVEREKWQDALLVVKRELELDPKGQKQRKRLVEVYGEIYKDNPDLDEFLKRSHLSQSWQNVQDAIASFEKHISFIKGRFVYHKSWGVGIISQIEEEEMVVDFAKKRGHKMTLDMAEAALNVLPKNHISVLKSILPKEKLKEKIQKDIPGSLRLLVGSYSEEGISVKGIKAELVPSVLSTSEWNSWSPVARKRLKTDPLFGNLEDKPDNYVLRSKPVSFEEKLFNRFKNTQNFFTKINLLREFLEESDSDSDYFSEMANFFIGYLRVEAEEFTLGSYFLLKELEIKYGYTPITLPSFSVMYETLENPTESFISLQDTELKAIFLRLAKEENSDWANFYVAVFPQFHTAEMLENLKESKEDEKLRVIISNTVSLFKDWREAFVWLAPFLVKRGWESEYLSDPSRIYINALNLYEITAKEIESRKTISVNRRLNKSLKNFLFKDDLLLKKIVEESQDNIVRLYSLVVAIDPIEDEFKKRLQESIKEIHPKLKLKMSTAPVAGSGRTDLEGHAKAVDELLTLSSSLIRKEKEMHHIHDVLIPQNSTEIGVARELGDLKENAEYIAAKEKQRELGKALTKLHDDLNVAKPIDLTTVDAKQVSFGTKVLLNNLDTEEEESYTILGPWESDPERGVISYQSPFASFLLGASSKKKLSFKINEREMHYQVKSIEVAQDPS